jgi:uncharacterized protein YaaN involved in tellurite resistance
MLKTNATRVYEQATTSAVDVETLKTAFATVMSAMDDIAQFKVKALSSMEQTVNSLTGEVDKAKAYVDRERGRLATSGADSAPPLPASGPPTGVARILSP